MTATHQVLSHEGREDDAAKRGSAPGQAVFAAQILAAAVVVFLLTQFSVWLGRPWGHGPPLWLASAAWLTFLLNAPIRRWPALILAGVAGNFAANLLAGDVLELGAGLSLTHATEVLVCAAGVRRFIGPRLDVRHSKSLVVFAMLGTACAFTAAALTAGWFALVRGAFSPSNFLVCGLAHALGLLILTPPLSLIAEGELSKLFAKEQARSTAIVFPVMALALVAAAVMPGHPLLLVGPPLLIFATLQLEYAGAALGILCVTGASVGFIAMGWTPSVLAGRTGLQQVLWTQGYLMMVTLMTFPIAMVLASRRKLGTALAASLDALQEANRQARLAENLAGIGYWRADLKSGLYTWSDEMYRIYGMDAADGPVPQNLIMERFHPDDVERVLANRRLYADKPAPDFAVRIIRADGEVRHVTSRSTVERNQRGAVVARFGTLTDVTEIKRVEAAAMESEKRFRFMAEYAPDMITRYSLASGSQYISPSCTRIFGRTPEEQVQLAPQSLVHPDDAERVMGDIGAMVTNKTERLPEPIRYRANHADGRWIWVEANPILIFDEQGEPFEFVDVVRDITLTKQFEEDLKEARFRAESAAAAKASFLANMSHELRTPLTSIIGFSRLMGDRADLGDEIKHFAKRINDASEALLAIINDVLDFSKLEVGQVNLEHQPLSVKGLLDETTGIVAIQAAAKGLDLKIELDPAVPELVLGDVARLRQILLNFLSNAVKFTATGSVTVSAGYRGSGEEARLRVAVIDTGDGITAEGVSRLFERFSQAEVSINRTHGGTGLGLAICKGIVELMGGQIGVDTKIGEGSSFWFDIPAAAAEAVENLEGAGEQIDCPPLKLLVVDDTPVNRELVKLMLLPMGFEIEEAGGGSEGIQAALSRKFDLVLMDVRMPGVDGLEATRVIRGAGGINAKTPILALTADVQPENASACRAAGMNDVIAKPISPSELLSKIVKWGSDSSAEAAVADDKAKPLAVAAEA